MRANRILEIDGETYDLYSLGMSVSGTYTPDGRTVVNIAMRLTPTMIDGDNVKMAHTASVPVTIGDVEANGDAADKKAFSAIRQALETWMIEKGL